MTRPVRPPDAAELARLIRVARGHAPADLLLSGGQVLNVYTGELLVANVAVAGRRIAYIGPSERQAGPATRVVDVAGRVLVPAYIEPHCHPYVLYNPVEFGRTVLARGTTTVVADDLFLFQTLSQPEFEALLEELAGLPLRIFWGVRLAAERPRPDGGTYVFPADRLRRSLELPRVVQTGELTSWPAALAEDADLLDALAQALAKGRLIDGHAAGCSYDTLAAIAAAGVCACHESVTADEALNRLRLGLHAMLRYQSLRPDLPALLRELRGRPLALQRLMLTTDGSSPGYYADGYSDRLVRLAMQEGLPPVDAYRMATLNPATYLGLDRDLGGLAPGRLADVLVLRDLGEPEPEQVYVEGRLVARDGALVAAFPNIDWSRYRFQKPRVPRHWQMPPERLRARHAGGAFPVMSLAGPAITRRRDVALPREAGRVALSGSDGLLYAALVDRQAAWVCQGVIEGFGSGIEGLASSFTASLDVLAIGSRPAAMALAVEAVFRQGGGIVLAESDEVRFSLALPLGGVMSELPMAALIAATRELERQVAERGYPYHDLIYTLLFLSSDALPDLRLTPAGLLQVKSRQVLLGPEALPGIEG